MPRFLVKAQKFPNAERDKEHTLPYFHAHCGLENDLRLGRGWNVTATLSKACHFACDSVGSGVVDARKVIKVVVNTI